MLFPATAGTDATTRLLIDETTRPDRLPVVVWLGADGAEVGTAGALGLGGVGRGASLLLEHAHGAFERPSLRGHRLADPTGDARNVGGRSWTTAFDPTSSTCPRAA